MATEIERKYLVVGDAWRSQAVGTVFRQGYLSTVKERVVRVRVAGDRGYLTIKGITVGAVRSEFEYEIPATEASTMLDELCEPPLIEKTRYTVEAEGLMWEIDEFAGVKVSPAFATVVDALTKSEQRTTQIVQGRQAPKGKVMYHGGREIVHIHRASGDVDYGDA